MAILAVILFMIICLAIFYFSPVTDIIDDIRSKYSIYRLYAKVEVVDKSISIQYNRLIFKITTQFRDTLLVSEVTPKDFNMAQIGDSVYAFLSDDGRKICDICQEEELDGRLETLRSFPLRIDMNEMEGR